VRALIVATRPLCGPPCSSCGTTGIAPAMGEKGRQHVEKCHALDKSCFDVMGAIDAAPEGRVATGDGAVSER
jgi:hypothetical protein